MIKLTTLFILLLYIFQLKATSNSAFACADTNAEYKTCPSNCPRSCLNKDKDIACNAACGQVPLCQCKSEYVIGPDGKCIKPDECPTVKTTEQPKSTRGLTTAKPDTTTTTNPVETTTTTRCPFECYYFHRCLWGCRSTTGVKTTEEPETSSPTERTTTTTTKTTTTTTAKTTEVPCIGCETCLNGYNDGCNTCTCGANGLVGCTEMYCKKPGQPFCKPDCSLVDCLSRDCGQGEIKITPAGECCPKCIKEKTICPAVLCPEVKCADNEIPITKPGECCPECVPGLCTEKTTTVKPDTTETTKATRPDTTETKTSETRPGTTVVCADDECSSNEECTTTRMAGSAGTSSLYTTEQSCIFDNQPPTCGKCGACDVDCFDDDGNCFSRCDNVQNPCLNNGPCRNTQRCKVFCGCRVKCIDNTYGSGAYRYGVMMGIVFVMGIFAWM